MEVLGRGRPESLVQAPVDGLVRPVVVAADHVGDAEVAVVDHAGELVGGGAVLADERDAVEPRHPELLRRFTVSLATLRLANRPLVPLHAQPLQVVENRLLAARHVSGRVGVVDPKQQPVAEAAVGDGRQRVPDVQRPGRARREANASHRSILRHGETRRRPTSRYRWDAVQSRRRGHPSPHPVAAVSATTGRGSLMSSLLVTKAAPRRRVWPWALAAIGVVCIGALAFAFFAWPSGGLRRRCERPAAGAAAALLGRSRRGLAPRRGRQDDPGGPAPGRHAPAQPSGPGRNATRGRGGLPPSRLGRLDRRAHAADAAGADGADRAAGLSLAARRAGSAGAGRLRPPRPRGSGDRRPSAEDDPPDATGAERRSRSVRRRGLGRRLRRRPRLGAPAAADRGDLVPARPHRDGPPVSGRRKASSARTRPCACASRIPSRRCSDAGCRRSSRPPPAAGGEPTRTRSSFGPEATASASTRT